MKLLRDLLCALVHGVGFFKPIEPGERVGVVQINLRRRLTIAGFFEGLSGHDVVIVRELMLIEPEVEDRDIRAEPRVSDIVVIVLEPLFGDARDFQRLLVTACV